MKRTAMLLLSAAALLAASGCALRKPVASHAVAFNRAAGESNNRLLLLNVVRAMNREPQQFTAITQVLGNASGSLSPSLTLPLVSEAQSSSTGTLGGSFSKGASTVTVGVLDSEEFTRAIMNPIDLDLLDYFMQQGWHEELLYMLFVRRIDIEDDTFKSPDCPSTCGKTTSYLNDPQGAAGKEFERLKCFRARLRGLIAEDLRIERGPAPQVGIDLQAESQDELAKLVLETEEAGLEVEKIDPRKCRDPTVVCYRIVGKGARELVWGSDDDRKTVKQAYDSGPDSGHAAVVYFRSTQGVLYYLGQIMRAQRDLFGRTVPSPASLEPRFRGEDGDDLLLFVAMAKRTADRHYGGAPARVEVVHGGETFVIPELSAADRSMQVLSIVTQLFGLNKKREDLPRTGVVSVSGS